MVNIKNVLHFFPLKSLLVLPFRYHIHECLGCLHIHKYKSSYFLPLLPNTFPSLFAPAVPYSHRAIHSAWLFRLGAQHPKHWDYRCILPAWLYLVLSFNFYYKLRLTIWPSGEKCLLPCLTTWVWFLGPTRWKESPTSANFPASFLPVPWLLPHRPAPPTPT